MKVAAKWLGRESTPETVNMWDTIIKPHLKDLTEDQQQLLDDAKTKDPKEIAKDFPFLKIKGRDKANKDTTKMVELLLFTRLADEMTVAYDRATLYFPEESGKNQQPMYEDETEYEGNTNSDGSRIPHKDFFQCRQDSKVCKCSQKAKVQFETTNKDVPCKGDPALVDQKCSTFADKSKCNAATWNELPAYKGSTFGKAKTAVACTWSGGKCKKKKTDP